MMYYKNPIIDIRFVSINGSSPRLEVLRGAPCVDASGAITGFVAETWEPVHTEHYDSAQEYRSISDLQASGGLVTP